jgi:hypothetical protein
MRYLQVDIGLLMRYLQVDIGLLVRYLQVDIGLLVRLLGSTQNLLRSTHEILASRYRSTQLFTINKEKPCQK